MDLQLANNVAYVAGSSRGIGLAISQAFLAEGSRVVLTGRNAESLNASASALAQAYGADQVMAFCGDLEDATFSEHTLAATARRWGRLDCVVANVGAGTDATGWDITTDEWQRTFGSNFWSSQHIAQQAIPLFTKTGAASLTFISSLAGAEEVGAPAPYAVAKSALIAFSKSLARILGPAGIRVNVVAPGNVLFPGGRWERRLATHGDELGTRVLQDVPLGRFGSPKEIADAVVFLASRRASFISGACLLVDGGQSRTL